MNFKKIILICAGCTSLAWGQRVTVQVPANQAWTRTGIFIEPGSAVTIDATGQIEAVSPADTRPLFHRVPPEGRAERQSNKPQPSMPALVMLGRIGNGPVFAAGNHTELSADSNRSGELELGINDDNVNDNTGSWTATITVRAGAPATTQDRRTGQTQNAASQDRGGNSNNQPRDQRNAGGPAYQDRGANPPNYQDRDPRNAGGPSYDQRDRDPRDQDRYRAEDQYRPDYRSSEYYRRYGHGFAVDEAVRICQQDVSTQASRRFRTPDIHFNRTRIDDSPGRNDWVIGTLDIHRGSAREERFRFSCSVDFGTGRVRSAELDQRPLPDDPRGR